MFHLESLYFFILLNFVQKKSDFLFVIIVSIHFSPLFHEKYKLISTYPLLHNVINVYGMPRRLHGIGNHIDLRVYVQQVSLGGARGGGGGGSRITFFQIFCKTKVLNVIL